MHINNIFILKYVSIFMYLYFILTYVSVHCIAPLGQLNDTCQ